MRCKGEVLASGGISFKSSSVKLGIGKDVSDDKDAMDARSCSGVIFSETCKSVMESISCFLCIGEVLIRSRIDTIAGIFVRCPRKSYSIPVSS